MVKQRLALVSLIAGCLFVGLIVLNADSSRLNGPAVIGQPVPADLNVSPHGSLPGRAVAKSNLDETLPVFDTGPFTAINPDADGFAAGEPDPGKGKITEEQLDEASAELIKAAAEAVYQAELAATNGTDNPGDAAITADEPQLSAEEQAAQAEDELREEARSALDRMALGFSLSAAEKDRLSPYIESEAERGRSGGLDNVGGPDASNYYFMDNVAPDTATYNWIELRGDPGATWINDWSSGFDDTYSIALRPIGFDFPFYGVNQTSFRVSTNGVVQFTTTGTSLSNACLPTTLYSGPAIFPFWDDLHLQRSIPSGVDVVGYKNFGTYTVIEFDSIGFFSSSCVTPLKFQVILYNDGKIKLQYNMLDVPAACLNSATIGIQSNGVAGSAALNYVCNATGIQPTTGRAIWFFQNVFANEFRTTSIASPAGYYATNTVVPVTARFTNVGSTTQSAPVKYSFNGGPVVTETSASLAQNAFEDRTFGTSITTPVTPGVYTITVWTDLATDAVRGNDTLRSTITVGGGDCADAILLSGVGPDSLLFNNCGTGDTSPGQPCGASGQDMVFSINVPNGSQLVVWQRADNTILGRHTLRWGGACPGDNFVDCSTTESRRMRFVNRTGSTQTAWVTVGNTTAPGTCGNLGVGWQLTTCNPTSTPLIEGFETTLATPIFPDCWGMANGGTGTAIWENYATNPRTGTRSASILGTAAGNDDWLFSPGVSLTGGLTYVVDFWWRGASTTTPESLEVKAGTVNTPSGMTLNVFAMDTIKRTVYVQKISNFTPPTTGTYYFGWHNMTMRSTGRTYIDDVQIYPSGACSAPVVTVNAAIGQDSTALVANVVGGSGGPPEYQWFTGLGCLEPNRIVGARSQTYYAPTTGTYSCRAWIIDSLNCASCDSAYATVIDCSLPTALPYFEGFESTSGSAFPTCWTVRDYNADARTWVTTTLNPRTGVRATYCTYSSSGNPPNDWLFTPRFALTAGTNYLLDFWWREYLVSTLYYDSIEVLLTTAPNNSSTVAVIVPAFRAPSSTYTNTVQIFSPPTTGNFYIAFRYHGGDNDGGVVIDDIALAVGGTCTAPTVSVADSSGIGTVTMFCNAVGGSGGALQYQWYTGQTCTPANRIVGATSSTYNTTVNGDFACLAWRYDSLLCSGCDWGTATVTAAPPGYDCSNPIVLTTASEDSANYNNCNMGHNNPGQSCGNSINDMVFRMAVPNGYTASIYQYFNDFDSRHSLRWGGACPGDNLVGCIDDPDYTQYTWMNCTGSTQNVYFVVGYYSTSILCGNFRLRWSLAPTALCPDVNCTPTVTETEPNNGCGVDNTFNTIVCGSVIRGAITATPTVRDVDVYELTLTQPQNLVITATSEFDALVEVRTATAPGACPDVLLQSINSNGNCAGESRTLYQVPAGVVRIAMTSPFVETCGPQNYCMTVQCQPSSPEPGETCISPYILTPPAANDSVVATGTTTGRIADCVDSCEYASSAPDVFFSLTLTSCRRITMKLEDTGSSGDMHISVYDGAAQCCVNAIMCNDDRGNFATLTFETPAQRPLYIFASFVGGELPAGTYLIRVSRYGSATTGNYRLVVFDNGACPACVITCQPQDVIEATENRYDQTFYLSDPNGGCNSTPPVFGAVNCSQTVCGVGFTYQRRGVSSNSRDTDWYQFTTAQRGFVRLTINAGFPASIAVIDVTNCATPVILFGTTADACVETLIGDTLNAGTYAMTVLPTSFVGNPMPTRYRATLYCQPPCSEPTDMTAYLVNADGGPIANDIQLRWFSQAGFPGTYKIYVNNTLESFPGGAGWTVLTGNIPPNLTPPYATTYNHLNVTPTAARKYYLVVGECN